MSKGRWLALLVCAEVEDTQIELAILLEHVGHFFQVLVGKLTVGKVQLLEITVSRPEN